MFLFESNLTNNFPLQVEHKLASVDRSTAGTGKHGASGVVDRDRVRSSILDEAAIVCEQLFILRIAFTRCFYYFLQ